MSTRTIAALLATVLALGACAGADPGGAGEEEPTPTTAATPAGSGGGGPAGAPAGDDGSGAAAGGGEDGDGGGPGGVATEQRTDDEDDLVVPFHVHGNLWSDEPSGCNQDAVVIQMTGELTVGSGDILGAGTGAMNFLDLSRCPGTDYGGHETTDGPTVQIIGSVDGEGWTLSFDFDDATRSFFTDGSTIGEGPILDFIAMHSTGSNVEGPIISFHVTHEQLDADEPAYFEVRTPTETGAWYTGAFGVAWGEDGNTEAFVSGLSDVAAAVR
ncbi:MAG: hypothetical protein AAFZ07_18235 [Actinomycetota bacterium]